MSTEVCLSDPYGTIISSILLFILALAGCTIFHYRRESLTWQKHHLDLTYKTLNTEHAYKMTIQSLENRSAVKEFVINHYKKKLSKTEASASSVFNEARSHHQQQPLEPPSQV